MSFVDESMFGIALQRVGDIVVERAAAVDGSVAFVDDGRIVRERADGTRVDLGPSSVRKVRLAQRVGALR